MKLGPTLELEQAREKFARQYNLRRRDVQYMPGELVWRKNFMLSDAANFYAAKLAPKYVGPFIVRKRVSPWTYTLTDDLGKDKGTWNVKELRPYRD